MPGVYISYPFCAQKCTYCNFASGVLPRELQPRYVAALAKEIGSHDWQWIPDTVYLGGGTPSQMPPAHLADVMSRIPGKPWTEATMEAAPGSLTPANVAAWVECGINRVSLGVQSFVPKEISRTGRKHSAEIVTDDIALLKANGITNVNIDLIAGLPGQTIDSWRESLNWIAKLQPPHVSIYMLEVDEDSRLGQEVLLNGKRYGAPDVPGDSAIVDMYESAVEKLAQLGIHRYEISNFARPGFESLHNLKYWRLEPYIGFGADAHSFNGEMRTANVEEAAAYVSLSESGQPVSLAATPAHHHEEKFFVGLRLAEGITPNADDWTRYAKPLNHFIAEGLVELDGEKIRLTERGILVSNEIFEEFVTLE